MSSSGLVSTINAFFSYGRVTMLVLSILDQLIEISIIDVQLNFYARYFSPYKIRFVEILILQKGSVTLPYRIVRRFDDRKIVVLHE